MPMTRPEDFGGGNPQNKYCVYCSNPDGSLKPRSVVREQIIRFWMSREKLDRHAAERAVDEYMSKMPAWRE